MPRRAKLWKWSVGGYGATVRVGERSLGGTLYLFVPKNGGGWRKISLGHRDRERAQRTASELSARRQGGEGAFGTLTVSGLFDTYLSASLPKQGVRQQHETRRIAALWCRVLGSSFDVTRIGPREWESFIRLRASGELDGHGVRVEKRGPSGAPLELASLAAPTVLGERAFMDDSPSAVTVTAQTLVTGLQLTRSVYERFIREQPAAGSKLHANIARLLAQRGQRGHGPHAPLGGALPRGTPAP